MDRCKKGEREVEKIGAKEIICKQEVELLEVRKFEEVGTGCCWNECP